MNSKKYSYIIIFISITILATIGLQIFWNIKNYEENKNRLVNEVQIALDNSIEYYYVEDSKENFLSFINESEQVSNDDFMKSIKLDTVFKNSKKISNSHIKTTNDAKKNALKSVLIDTASIHSKKIKHSVILSNYDKKNDSTSKNNIKWNKFEPNEIKSITVLKGKKASDSIMKLKNLANKIVVSLAKDSLEFDKISKALNKELNRKNIQISYDLIHLKADTIFDSFESSNKNPLTLQTFSKSTYLPNNQGLKLSFSNPTRLLLKRSLTEITLSLLLSLSIIGCLLYLLKIINQQKKIDEIKNDFISNITHEFKTPITTVSTAIEGIRNFNHTNDTEKTNRYLDISNQQLIKLEGMVEKLLETASIETDKLLLQKKSTDLVALIHSLIEKNQFILSDKKLNFETNLTNCFADVDCFHFENVISNLIDNAIKYGGNQIIVKLVKDKNAIKISIEDNGKGIDKQHRNKVFDKFYRVPKGNVHDVKGFGIGLYYSKKIVEKHGGTLTLIQSNQSTIFQLLLSDERKN